MPNPAELKKIFAGAREARLDEEQLRDLVEQVSGQRSTRALDRLQTHQVIEQLVRLGARAGRSRKPAGRKREPGVAILLTGPQRDYIADLRTQLGGDWEAAKYFEGACRKVIHKDGPTTSADGERVIEMLRARLRYNQRKQSGAAG